MSEPDPTTPGRKTSPEFSVNFAAPAFVAEFSRLCQTRLLSVPTGTFPDSGSEVSVHLEVEEAGRITLRAEVKQLLPTGFLARLHLGPAEREALDQALLKAKRAGPPARADPRYSAVFPVTLKLEGEKSVEYVRNLSRSGMFIKTRTPPPLGSVIKLQLRLPDGQPPIDAEATVVRSVTEESAAKTGSTPGVGVRLGAIDAPLQARLDALIASIGERAGKGAVVVDDDAVVRTAVSDLLEEQGFRVWQAASGDEALALIQQHLRELRIVLLDLVMPGRDGFDVLTGMREATRARGIALVVMTGAGPEIARCALDLGADEAILKGAQPDEILAVVEAALASQKTGG